MKLSEIKLLLPTLQNVAFRLPDGTPVPEHFHVTEVGLVSKHFIDCGGNARHEQRIGFQLWDADDYEHRLKPGKLLRIIELCDQKLGLPDSEIEVEYQGQTIGKYGLAFNGTEFVLLGTKTACLAQEACGVPAQNGSPAVPIASCGPGTGCCP